MHSPLDAVRERAGLRPARPVSPSAGTGAAAPGRLAPAAAWGPASDRPTRDQPAGAPGSRTRLLLGAVTALSGGVASAHHLLAAALAHRHGLLAVAYAVLNWPLPLAQQILAGTAAVTTAVVGVQTGGWTRLTRPRHWLLLAAMTAAVFGAGPMVSICLLIALVVALAAAAAIVVVSGLLALFRTS